jgi:hypothetical protein
LKWRHFDARFAPRCTAVIFFRFDFDLMATSQPMTHFTANAAQLTRILAVKPHQQLNDISQPQQLKGGWLMVKTNWAQSLQRDWCVSSPSTTHTNDHPCNIVSGRETLFKIFAAR